MVGHFKVPFGREQLISSTDIDFAFRTLASEHDPAGAGNRRDGARPLPAARLTYEVGVFDGDGDNGRLQEAQFQRDDTTRQASATPSRLA